MKKQKYKTISYLEAVNLKQEKHGKFYKEIPFNNGNIFILSDSSFIILPVNPYSTSFLFTNEIIWMKC